MRGFTRQRGDAWELRVYLGQDIISGKKRYATRTIRGSRREAERVLARMVGEVDRGGFAHTGATTGVLLERWFTHACPDFSPKTIRETRGYLDRDLLPALGGVPLDKLRTEERSIEDVNAHYPHGWQHLGEGARKLGDARSDVEHLCARLCETFRQSSELAGDRRREQTSGRSRCTSLGEERVVVRVPSRLGRASLCRFDCLSHRTHDRLAECAAALYTQVRQPWRENEIPVRTSDREPALNQDTFDWRIEFIV